MFEIGEVKLRIDKNYRIPARIEQEKDRLLIHFRYNLGLKDHVKSMEGARWHGNDDINPRKVWSVKDSERNRFQLMYLMDKNPYAPYDLPLVEFKPKRKLYDHQVETTAFILTRRHCIIAEEMGVGKTLAAIEALETVKARGDETLWVGPGAALDSVRYEYRKWLVGFRPEFSNYASLRKLVENWSPGRPAPRYLILDECQKIKNPTAQQSQAAAVISNFVRREYGRESMVVLMSGTPAPRDPSDWWHLCEVACPGFLKEGTHQKFKNAMGLIKTYESLGGATFPKLITWYDDERKCKECGMLESDPNHMEVNMCESFYHAFRPSINEVLRLYDRMKGLVIVKFKRDCLDLPEKRFVTIECKPAANTLRAANTIVKTATSVIKGLTLLRELSDGFQYTTVIDGKKQCPTCKGTLKFKMRVDADDPDNPLDSESLTHGHRAIWDQDEDSQGYIVIGYKEEPLRIEEREIGCPQCNGFGEVDKEIKTPIRVDCPKEAAIINLLEQYEDEGRVVMWAGFSDSVDRLTEICIKQGWPTIRLDGRGYWSNNFTTLDGVELLSIFDDKINHPKVAWVAQPGAGGLGINLTASSMEVFYSNTFRGEDRAQAIDRIHRPGADHNRGCTIFDLVHLPQDRWVLDNLGKKMDLQYMAMGVMKEEMERYSGDERET